MRTRVKFCGFTRAQDVHAAIEAGADALGFVLYDQSPRYIEPERVAELVKHIPAFINTVGLFVNAAADGIVSIMNQVPLHTVQLHGDETWSFATRLERILQRPVIKAVRVNAQTDWAEVAAHIHQVSGVLLDADSVGYGGSGHQFDWQVIPDNVREKIILSGGLGLDTISRAIQTVRPYALDVSSGIESGVKGVKDKDKMHAFIQRVQAADARQ
ncbi:phosphoribosylanthranilate isomerase [Hydromonas duriensis]|uniref:N-(5'-phosphoribosyl)anthranilate isomerase n=1 Tax=Hydromonas duriensis TaxID=1527608 RepID=A0A4R6Y8V4_9BURK|nr:phosphoribosylanthranilate isomerase [Hydromonas duriensis]TDR31869.1 phosphoribosylanthranilate isomerase [Hydromonas duriensis]